MENADESVCPCVHVHVFMRLPFTTMCACVDVKWGIYVSACETTCTKYAGVYALSELKDLSRCACVYHVITTTKAI